MDVEQAWNSFKKTGESIQKTSLKGQLDTIAAQLNEIQQNTKRTAELVPKIMGDDAAINSANGDVIEGGADMGIPMDMTAGDDVDSGDLSDLLGGEMLSEGDEEMTEEEKISETEETMPEEEVDSPPMDDTPVEDEPVAEEPLEESMDEPSEEPLMEEEIPAEGFEEDIAPEPMGGAIDAAKKYRAIATLIESGEFTEDEAKSIVEGMSAPSVDEAEPLPEIGMEEEIIEEEPLMKSAGKECDIREKVAEILNNAMREIESMLNGEDTETPEAPSEEGVAIVIESDDAESESKTDVNEEIANNPIEASCDSEEAPVMKSITDMISMKKTGKPTIFDEVKPVGGEVGSDKNVTELIDELGEEKSATENSAPQGDFPIDDVENKVTKHIKTFDELLKIRKSARPDSSFSVNGQMPTEDDIVNSIEKSSKTESTPQMGYGVDHREVVKKDWEDYKKFMYGL